LENYIPKEQRKKILFISDVITGISGVANVSKDIISRTAHHYNYINIGVSLEVANKGKRWDLSQDTNNYLGITDAQVISVEWDRYADPNFIKQVVAAENPDALVFITDPRQYVELFAIEHELRTGSINGKPIPLIYIQVWDNYPQPNYNYNFYKSVDLSLCINKQTVLINQMILKNEETKPIIKYFPHGVNADIFHPIPRHDEQLLTFKSKLLGGRDVDFIAFFNSRNIRRKCISDLIMGFKGLLRTLTPTQASKCFLVLHSPVTDPNGTDLMKVTEALLGEQKTQVIFDGTPCLPQDLNLRYNIADVTCLVSNAEGFGLSGLESMMTGTPILVNVTGGIADYCRFEDEKGSWFTPSEEVWSNHNKSYTKCGEWVFPVFPAVSTIAGSIPTPYIFEDIASFKDIADQLVNAYHTPKEELDDKGYKGRQWALSEESGMSLEVMTTNFIKEVDELLEGWKGRAPYIITKIDKPKQSIEIKIPDYLFEKN
jgi:glycosyltransferase involved in cell wall biosynthesis